jgi:hypothetical protein
MPTSSNSVNEQLIRVADDLWKNPVQDLSLEQLQQTLEDFQAQVLVLQSFDLAEQSLRKNERLPKKLIERVKNFLGFVYGKYSPQSNDKRIRLQELESYAIIFCGLSYHITDIHRLSPKQFDFVVQHIAGFINTRGLIRHLYRSDIENNVGHKLNPHDKKLFHQFLQGLFVCHTWSKAEQASIHWLETA